MIEETNIELRGSVLIDWLYPQIYSEQERDFIEIEPSCVRACNAIRISYDAERDGYVLCQPVSIVLPQRGAGKEGKYFETEDNWVETAFLPAWPFEQGTIIDNLHGGEGAYCPWKGSMS